MIARVCWVCVHLRWIVGRVESDVAREVLSHKVNAHLICVASHSQVYLQHSVVCVHVRMCVHVCA